MISRGLAPPPASTTSGQLSIKKKFEITEKINPTAIMGIEVERARARRWGKLHQTQFATALLLKHNMSECNRGTETPVDPGMAKAMMLLPTDGPRDPEIIKKYQSLVGDLMWMLKTRPDLLFTVNLLSRYLQCATKEHYNFARDRPLRYLRETLEPLDKKKET